MIDDETRFQNWLKRLDEYVKVIIILFNIIYNLFNI